MRRSLVDVTLLQPAREIMQEVRRLTIINDTSLSFLKDYIWHRKASWKTPPRDFWGMTSLIVMAIFFTEIICFDWFTSKMISIDLLHYMFE